MGLDYNTKRAYKNEIRKIRKVDYLKAISLCKDLLKLSENNDDKWFCYHNMALMYKKLEDIKRTLKYSSIALQCVKNSSPDYYLTLWLFAECLQELKRYKEARKMYYKCSKYYKSIDDELYRITVVFNIAKSKKDINKILRIIKIAESNELNRVLDDHEDLNNLIFDMYKETLEICISDLSLYKNIFKVVNSINNNDIKKELTKNLKLTYPKVS